MTGHINGKYAETELVLASIRCLAADLVQQFNGGHAGTPIGAAPIAISLWRDVMTFNPQDPLWPGRDRFVLSAGHACLFQYIMLHLTGYPGWTLDELKRYHSRDFATSRAAGHPEIEQSAGIEVTTGPLGQGIANAVGLAIAQKQVETRYARSGYENLFNNKVWCFTGDGCLQEGVGQEAISMAGHLGLNNLILIYDQNAITVDGSIANCFSEDVPARFRAADWNVLELPNLADASADEQVDRITDACINAKKHQKQPTLLVIPTVIAYGSRKANTGPAHGQPLGVSEVKYIKERFNVDPTSEFGVPTAVYRHFEASRARGASEQDAWQSRLQAYGTEWPDLYEELKRRLEGHLTDDNWRALLPDKAKLPKDAQPTRKSSGIVVEALAPSIPNIVAGSADLLESTFVSWKGMIEFQKPSSGLGDYTGRQLRYGIREHSMAAIANGIAAYFPVDGRSPGCGFLPVYSTFFMFTSYALPAIRMAALQRLRTVIIATHDSIGIGEDGPTHQPIALATFFRALPNAKLWRPADAEETMAAWIDAIEGAAGPTILCLSRQPVPMLAGSDRAQARRGAYIVRESVLKPAKLVLVATGAEVSRAIEVAELLEKSSDAPIPTRVVSMPNMATFDKQSREYRSSVIPASTCLVIAIEAWAAFGWAKYAHASFSMSTFGHSGPQADLFEHFGFGVKNLARLAADFVQKHTEANGNLSLPGVGDFVDLLEGYVSHVPHY